MTMFKWNEYTINHLFVLHYDKRRERNGMITPISCG